MKKILLATLAAVAMTGAAGAASAQPYGGPDRDRGYERDYGRGYYVDRHELRQLNMRQAELRRRIDWAVERRRVSYGEGERLRYEIRDINQMERRFRDTGGIDRRELRILQSRLDRVEGRLHRFAWNDYR
ncbi:hypothetical protein [Caulobacter mirabilis]|nr:hypothetical protein [Caulobacter mirabilis]